MGATPGVAAHCYIPGQITTPEDAAAFTQDVADKWRQANRLLLERYKQWGAQKAEAGG